MNKVERGGGGIVSQMLQGAGYRSQERQFNTGEKPAEIPLVLVEVI